MSCFPGRSVFVDRNRGVSRNRVRWIQTDDAIGENNVLDPSISVVHDNGNDEPSSHRLEEPNLNKSPTNVGDDSIKDTASKLDLDCSSGKTGVKKASSAKRTRKKGSKKCVKKEVFKANGHVVESCKSDESMKKVNVTKKSKVLEKSDEKVDCVKNQKNQSWLSRRRISDWVSRSSDEKWQEKGSKNLAKITRSRSSSMSSRSKTSDDKKEKTTFRSELDINPLLPNNNYPEISSFAPVDSERSLSECSSLSSSSSSLSSSCSRHSIIKHYTDIMMNRGVADPKNGSVKSKIDRILKSPWEDRLNRTKEKAESNNLPSRDTATSKTSFILRPSKLQFNKKTWLKLKKSNSRTDWLFNANTTSSQKNP